MRTVALIPARAGSQRCPRKNLAELGNIPLIEWTINAAYGSKVFDDLIISTDDPDIVAIGKERKCSIIKRPAELARADTPMFPVVQHAAGLMESDVIILLQPTSPFRSAEDIALAFSMLTTFGSDSVVSVTAAPKALAFEIGFANRLREAKNIVVENGALYLIKTEHLKTGGDWYDGIVHSYLMPKERSLDIDSPFDLEMARMMVKQRAAA